MHRKQDKGLKGGIFGQRLKAVRAACRREDFLLDFAYLASSFLMPLGFMFGASLRVCVCRRGAKKSFGACVI